MSEYPALNSAKFHLFDQSFNYLLKHLLKHLTLYMLVARPLLIQKENILDIRIDILAVNDVKSSIVKSHLLTIIPPDIVVNKGDGKPT